MTTYNTIADTDIDQDSPITANLFQYLRDNPIAITEGASGAPQIQTAAIADGAVTPAKLSTTPGLTLVQTVDLTSYGSANIDLTSWSGTYTSLLITGEGVRISSGGALALRASDDGGSTVEADAGDYIWQAEARTGTTGTMTNNDDDDGNDTQIELSATQSLDASVDFNFRVSLYGLGEQRSLVEWSLMDATDIFKGVGSIMFTVDGLIRILTTSGTFGQGTLKVYGYA